MFPNYPSKQGILDTAAFSKDLGFTAETLYRAFRSNRLTPAVARRLIELSKADGNLTISRHDLFDDVLPGDD